MSELRKRMNDAMVLRGFAERTKESYLACIFALAKHTRRSPDSLDAAAIQAYLLHLITEKKLAYSSVNQAVCAIRFLFAVVLGQEKFAYEVPMAKVPKRLPQILTREERSGSTNLNRWISGNSGQDAGSLVTWRTGVFDEAEIRTADTAHA